MPTTVADAAPHLHVLLAVGHLSAHTNRILSSIQENGEGSVLSSHAMPLECMILEHWNH